MLDSTTVRVVSMLENPHTAAPTADTSFLSREATAPARRLHRSMTGYAPTPLVELSGLAKRGGVRSVLVKDESPRFGLNAFKALRSSPPRTETTVGVSRGLRECWAAAPMCSCREAP